MRIFLDTANLEDIRYFNEFFPIEGVTTNPTILSKEGGDVVKLLKDIREIIGYEKELHVQVTETNCDKIIEEAKAIVELLGQNTFVKIPVTDEGLKATKLLTKMGYKVTVTAILTAAQALLAANSGAAYVAPYVSRLENVFGDGVGTVADIARLLKTSKSNTQILAASFKTAKEVLDVAVVGCHAATIGSTIMKMLLAHTTTDTSIEGFKRDWKSAFGNTTLLELIQKQK
jgi:fructose-6-phosphate aldolase 2